MQLLLFTKLLKDVELDEAGRIAAELGFDGIDLLVRPGWHLVPERPEEIGPAVKRIGAYGLSVPAVTTDITDPQALLTDAIFGACADAGVRLIRLGFFTYGPGDCYREVFERTRRHLDAIEAFARKHGVRSMIQIHGGSIQSSGALLAALLDGHDPAYLGAYPDPGNQAVQEGREDWRLTFDMLAPWVCFVGVKNGGWSAGSLAPSGQRRWTAYLLGLADGMVPWDEILPYLAEHHPDAPLSLHSHYEVPLAHALDQTRTDLNFVKRVLAGSRGTPGDGTVETRPS
ncbi:MAG: sugar phosphate isomerase/epimerase [Chloroflexi bacterium]|nr:sugar phosphate isomerase/epimerase [Chloroflexota bacterium]